MFGIADDILVVGYDNGSKYHDDRLQIVLQICRQVNLKLNKDKMSFQMYIIKITSYKAGQRAEITYHKT